MICRIDLHIDVMVRAYGSCATTPPGQPVLRPGPRTGSSPCLPCWRWPRPSSSPAWPRHCPPACCLRWAPTSRSASPQWASRWRSTRSGPRPRRSRCPRPPRGGVVRAGGGVAGGILLDLLGAGSFPWSVLVLLVPVLVVVVGARTHRFPAQRATTTW